MLKALPILLLLCCVLGAGEEAPSGPYSLDFESLQPGAKLPDDILILNGKFAVREVDGNKLLELPAGPLDSFGLLFGQSDHAAVDVTARVHAAATGRRYPEFAVGAGDAGGHKLWVLPGRKELVIRKGDEPVAVVPLAAWESGAWTHLRLRVEGAGEDKWSVRGKVWAAGADEPRDWMIAYEDLEEPSAGRASVWGHPNSGKPIRFDDLKVAPVGD